MAALPRVGRHNSSIRAVLFDLSGTLIDERYLHHGLMRLAASLQERWNIDPTTTRTGFMPAFRVVTQARADQPFYLMREVICSAVEQLIMRCGHAAKRNELVELEQLFWTAAIPAASAADGACATLRRLHDAGVRTAIVSFADIPVFEALLEQTGLAGLTDAEVCSEMARSCKPHPGIFQLALRSLAVPASDALFVGDDIDTDVVGANRIGLRTALLAAREFTVGDGSHLGDPATRPDHHIDCLDAVVDIVIGGHRSGGDRGVATDGREHDRTVTLAPIGSQAAAAGRAGVSRRA